MSTSITSGYVGPGRLHCGHAVMYHPHAMAKQLEQYGETFRRGTVVLDQQDTSASLYPWRRDCDELSLFTYCWYQGKAHQELGTPT